MLLLLGRHSTECPFFSAIDSFLCDVMATKTKFINGWLLAIVQQNSLQSATTTNEISSLCSACYSRATSPSS